MSAKIKFLEDIENEIGFDINFQNLFDASKIESNLIDIIKQITYIKSIENIIIKDFSENEENDESTGKLINE